MFDWFKRKKPEPLPTRPTVQPAKPVSARPAPSAQAPAEKPHIKGMPPPGGIDTTGGEVAFANGQRTWSEEFNVVRTLAAVLQKHGLQLEQADQSIRLAQTNILLSPRLQGMKPIHPKGAQTTTTIQCMHPAFGEFGMYEYQHSAGDSIEDALHKGFERWANIDLVVLADALSPKPRTCMVMEAELPATAELAARTRRGIMGPIEHMQQNRSHMPEEHPFCACCFFTRTHPAFDRFFTGDGFFALRFFGMRDENGKIQADCRINGDEFEEGKAAIRKYVATWPDRGVEFRKQYVVFQDWAPNRKPEWRSS
jgi:hypothetical protein